MQQDAISKLFFVEISKKGVIAAVLNQRVWNPVEQKLKNKDQKAGAEAGISIFEGDRNKV